MSGQDFDYKIYKYAVEGKRYKIKDILKKGKSSHRPTGEDFIV